MFADKVPIIRSTKVAHKLKVLPEQPDPATQSRIGSDAEEDDEDEDLITAGKTSDGDAEGDDEEPEVRGSSPSMEDANIDHVLVGIQANCSDTCWYGAKGRTQVNEEGESKAAACNSLLYCTVSNPMTLSNSSTHIIYVGHTKWTTS